MYKMLMLLTGFITGATLCPAQTDKDPDLAHHTLLWKISGQHMEKPSYLLGTIHLICRDDFYWNQTMDQCLYACREVCFELDIDDPSVMMTIASGMIDPSGRKLEEYFTPEEFALLESFVQDSTELHMASLMQMKPAALGGLFASRMIHCTDVISLETKILEKAQSQQLLVSGLEDPEEQLALLDSLPSELITDQIMRMVRNESSQNQEYQSLLKYYKAGNLDALYRVMKESKTAGIYLAAFLHDRNKKWISRMEDKMEQGPVFFAVGAGHLPGADGLIELLKKEGYHVSPVQTHHDK